MTGRMAKVWATVAVMPLVAMGLWVAPGTPAQAAGQPAIGALSHAQAQALSSNVSKRVIVILKDQVPQAPASRAFVHARSADVARDQRPILTDLSATKARNVHTYVSLNAVSATVSPGEEARLQADPAVAEVVPDQIIRLASPFDAPASATAAASAPHTTPAGVCPAAHAPPLLTPQALSVMHVDSTDPTAKTARSLGIDGSGVKVAFIADGLNINDTDFIRADGSHVFVDYKDFSGEGTNVATGGEEAFIDSSSIAAQGRVVYNVENYSALGPNTSCRIRIEGVAPGASLVGLDIFGAEDAGFNSSFLQAIDYAVSVDHVNVLNESLGNNYYPDDAASLDVIKQANDAAVAAGTTVTVSSGDAGVTNTIGTPSTDPNVLSVGATTTYQEAEQLGYGGEQFPGVTGAVNNNISALSSSGFDQDGDTISLVAPGESNWVLCSRNTAKYDECTNFQGKPSNFVSGGGTSESAPLTAGAAALVIQAYAKTHGGTDPSPAVVKQILTSTADDIAAPADEQGSGLVDAYRAVLAAEAYKAPAPANTASTLLESVSQFNAVGSGGSTQRFTEQFTNEGSSPLTLSLSSRTLGAYRSVGSGTVTLSDTASPHSVDYQGITDNYGMVNFTVPAGVDRLNGAIAFQGASTALASRVRLALVDPDGRLADYSLPQGVGNYGDAQVADPTPGQWTAYIWSRDSADGGTTGPVVFGASVANYQSFGSVSPSTLTVRAGSTAPATLTVRMPSTPGDTSGSLVANVPGQAALAIPVTLRTLVPSGPTSFDGVLTGGNGRASFTGVTEYYQLDVAAGRPALNASVTLADNPDNTANIWLIDPSGQAQASQSNTLITEDTSTGQLFGTAELGANVHVVDPVAGRWTIIVVFAPAVSGTALSEGFTVAANENRVPVSAHGVPNGGTVSASHPAVVKIKVTNNSTAPEAYFVDARLNQLTQYNLATLDDSQATVPLSVNGNIPVYLAPSETTELDASAQTTGPDAIQFDMSAPTGDPDIASGQGSSVGAALTGNPVTAGEYAVVPDVVGPFGGKAAPSETVDTQLVATTQAFDPDVTSGTGDLWFMSLGAGLSVSPVVVPPGGSAIIPVIITPSGAPGSTVSGTLYLDDDSLLSVYGSIAPNANTLAAIPYSYTVG